LSETKDRLKEAMKAYMKEKNQLGLNTVRMMLSEIQVKEKEKHREDELKEDEVIAVITFYRKRLLEALEGMESAGRDTSSLLEEIEEVKKFLPEPLSQEEVEELIKAKIEELSAGGEGPKFGDLMRATMAEVKGRADGKMVNETVKRLLG
jgi:uncharacterized protein YqeY